MAYASASWDEAPRGWAVRAPAKSRRALINTLLGCLVVVTGLSAIGPIVLALQNAHPTIVATAPNGTSPYRRAALLAATRSQLASAAARFLRESLPLTQRCDTGCAPIAAALADAAAAGSFVPAATLVASAETASGSGLRLARRFSAVRAPAADMAVPAPAPIRVASTMVVPLTPAALAAAVAPVPAPRLARPSNTAAEAADVPMQQASLAPTGRGVLPGGAMFGAGERVAVYDISAATVYMPNGERLEAHSGLGYMVDNVRYVDRRNSGPTPPNTYDLVALEGRFHGVEALRMVPVAGSRTFGRDGFLTHTYMLRGHPAQSNGCVVFKDYARFLAAFKRGNVRRLVVVPSLSRPPLQVASADEN